MARKIEARYIITGVLTAESPLHIGGVNNDPMVDLTLAVNGAGDYYIPGTSLAGALRGWMEELEEGSQIISTLWGPRLGQTGRTQSDDGASWVLVEDAVIQGDVQTELRDGVGIDRFGGSAAEYIKFDRAILPKGSKLDLHITLDRVSESKLALNDAEWKAACEAWSGLLQALQDGELSLGAAKTRGLGTVKLEKLEVKEQLFNSCAGILALLKGESGNSSIFNLEADTPRKARPALTVTIDWAPISPLMVKAEREGIAVDMLPLVSSIGDRVAFVLPGSSIKGALRTQAERIVRTVCPAFNHAAATKPADSKKAFLQQIEVPLVENLFGKAAKTEDQQQKVGMGALTVADCYADHSISVEKWEKVQTSKESSDLLQALQDAKLHDVQQAFHVAIDRWTGGAADQFLYSTLEPMGVQWQPIALRLNLSRLPGADLQKQGVALLLLVLRDLIQGRIPLGYGVNRGMGAIAIKSISFSASGTSLPAEIQALHDITLKVEPEQSQTYLTAQHLAQISSLGGLNDAWKAWIESTIPQEVAS
ncbi:RAMP superfamily CRISPR-associated protein [Thermoleptolyngbya sichuanensis XZ-Cy5]|uniref:RAMP superfamily CRISPR-associated protein n=1 Tax=Thermoleptolyngbya sichuanensis TaxID=2885951 RepID=UPI00240DB914|nr:RAMP superfamily CRISPR-associated protein [Thermoleptolyngbya sichuanensis]MDG2618058.1 RAMP superfamily CRISPR-associated protein [Thermoleptolyngbya sichuanensis XZ-Cy5]